MNRYKNSLISNIEQLSTTCLVEAITKIRETWHRGSTVIVFGNGGSALTALHYATDWSKSIGHDVRPPFRCRTLLDNVGILTAYANDASYEDIFLNQLKNILSDDDLIVAISGSGNSENVLRAVKYANSTNNTVISLTGYGGGRLKDISDINVCVEASDMQISEDIHMIFCHMAMRALTQ